MAVAVASFRSARRKRGYAGGGSRLYLSLRLLAAFAVTKQSFGFIASTGTGRLQNVVSNALPLAQFERNLD
jgi:hypothetical protein